jgi:hypothetical protein
MSSTDVWMTRMGSSAYVATGIPLGIPAIDQV